MYRHHDPLPALILPHDKAIKLLPDGPIIKAIQVIESTSLTTRSTLITNYYREPLIAIINGSLAVHVTRDDYYRNIHHALIVFIDNKPTFVECNKNTDWQDVERQCQSVD